MSVEVLTFGCRLNTYESEVMKREALAAGVKDAILVNTCAVTAEAERQARQAIRKARREFPEHVIIVSGCSAQANPAIYSAMPEVNLVMGNEEKMTRAHYAAVSNSLSFLQDEEKIRVNDIMSVKETAGHLVQGLEGRARAFLQVQNGCNHRCTFCIIPFGRGNSRSVPMGDIVREARALVENGYNEIVLTGVDVSDYGEDLPGAPTLGEMMTRLLKMVPDLKRLRLSSIDAVEVDEALYRLIGEEERLMPHLHISLQAGDDMVLKRMKRRHLRKDIFAFVDKVRRLRPDMVFGADIIAGFPTETDSMFENTLNMISEIDLTYLHIFPYSPRLQTPAAKMPQVEKHIIKQRAARLRDAGARQLATFLSRKIGTMQNVLMEKEMSGRTEHFAPVKFNGPQTPGSIINARIVNAAHDHLTGNIL